MFLIKQLRGLEEPDAPSFKRYFYLLEVIMKTFIYLFTCIKSCFVVECRIGFFWCDFCRIWHGLNHSIFVLNWRTAKRYFAAFSS